MGRFWSLCVLAATLFFSQEIDADLEMFSPRSDIPCTSSSVNYNVTLSQGAKAGQYYKLDGVPSIGGCVDHCCNAKKCDIAFVISKKCYLVSCRSKDSCKIKKSENAKYETSLAIMPRFHNKNPSVEKGGEPAISENLQAKSAVSNPFIIKENSNDGESVHAFGTTQSKRSKRSSDVIDLVVAVGCGTIAVAVGVAGVVMMTRRLIDSNKSSS